MRNSREKPTPRRTSSSNRRIRRSRRCLQDGLSPNPRHGQSGAGAPCVSHGRMLPALWQLCTCIGRLPQCSPIQKHRFHPVARRRRHDVTQRRLQKCPLRPQRLCGSPSRRFCGTACIQWCARSSDTSGKRFPLHRQTRRIVQQQSHRLRPLITYRGERPPTLLHHDAHGRTRQSTFRHHRAQKR